MKITRKYFLHLATLFCLAVASSQTPIQVVNTMTPQELVNALVDNECANISNVSVTGSDNILERSYCYFTSGGSDFPFDSGIILSTGYAIAAPGPNNSIQNNGFASWGGDEDLEASVNIAQSLNATVMEFDFIPATDHISFDYIFASEEYTSWTDNQSCNYSDGFAFLLKQVGSTAPYQNLAVIPGTNIPVKVTSVRGTGTCPSANTAYFDDFNGINYPTDFNGQTVVLTAEADVTAGTLYHIKLVIADQGDTLYDSAVFLKANSFSSTKELGDDRLLSEGTGLCDGAALPLDGTIGGAMGYQWYKDETAIPGATNALYTVTSEGDYKVEIQLTPTCFAHGEIRVEYATPIPSAPIEYYQCDDNGDGLTAYYLNRMQTELMDNLPGLQVTSFFLTLADAQANTTPLTISQDAPFYNTVADQQVFARMRNDAGCFGIVPIVLSTPAPFTGTLPVFDVCDDDGTDDGFISLSLTDLYDTNPAPGAPPATAMFFRTMADAIAYTDAIPAQFTNTVAGGQTVYVNLSTDSGCFAIMAMPVAIHSFGDGITPEETILCKDESITLDGGNYDSWLWDTTPPQTTRTITVDEPGIYKVTLTNDYGCEAVKEFTVNLSGRATDATVDTKDFTGNDNSLTIHPVGLGTYEYSLDGTVFQESPVFEHLPAGEYEYYIRDVNGCGPVYTDTVFILDYPAFFTPNGDGVNDTWRIPYGYYRPGIHVTVFDRYGKLITGFAGNSMGWDGIYNGSPLPSTDYWFVIELENGKSVKGHFAMIR